MPRAYVGIGSNINRETNIRGAVRELTAHFGTLMLSPVYETKAVGFEGADFYNLVAGFDTSEGIERIKEIFAGIETRFGRERGGERFVSRTLDLDLLLYGDTVNHGAGTDLPHPDIRRHAYVLGPLADIAPDFLHPETGIPLARMWQQLQAGKQELRKTDFDPEIPGKKPT